MRILYVTDLHGNIDKYNSIRKAAQEAFVDVVINGGDMLPKSGDLFVDQRDFITGFLDRHFSEYQDDGIHYFCMLGNDDIASNDSIFDSVIARYSEIKNIAQNRIVLAGYEFIGMNHVADYPFRLKDRCRMDSLDFVFPQQFGTGMLSQESGQYQELENWKQYARELSTIEDDLELLPRPHDYRKTIYVIHMPPSALGLDVCSDRREVGSLAVYNFIKKQQPLLTLHGHIHESPDMTGIWKANLGKTICVQPGQRSDLAYVIIDLENMSIERAISR